MKYLALAVLSIFLVSCAAAVLGVAGVAGGYVYVNGQLRDTIQAPLPRVNRACAQASKMMGFHTRKNVSDRLKGKMTAEMADGTKVYIWLKSAGPGITKIRIRVGYMGDRELSNQILRRIKNLL